MGEGILVVGLVHVGPGPSHLAQAEVQPACALCVTDDAPARLSGPRGSLHARAFVFVSEKCADVMALGLCGYGG